MEDRVAAFLMRDEGGPATLDVHVRTSQSAPGRMKVAFSVPTEGTKIVLPDGNEQYLPRQAGPRIAACPEFRIEMN